MTRSNVKVLLRTRPTENFASDAVNIDGQAKTVTIKHGIKTALGTKESSSQSHQFKFDGLLHNASQEAVFEACAAEVVAGALRGYNGTIMCYGQTGAGKTFTMTGGRHSYAQRGLIPRTIAALLAALRTAPGLASYSLGASYMEIYNEALYDLLDISTQPQDLVLYEDGRGTLQVQGLRKVVVNTEQEALALFFEGETNRVIGEHQLNRASSRSHCIFCLELQLVPEGGNGQALTSKVTLVDLAGSERVSKTRSDGQVLREAGYINKSLHMLEQVVLAASDKARDHVPYRSCKLTHVLKDSLGGNCNTVLMANIWGEAAQLEETLSTCRFAARMARMSVEVTSNVLTESSTRVKQLERQVQELQEELAMMAMFWGSRSPTAATAAAAAAAASGGGAVADDDAAPEPLQPQQPSPYAPLSEPARQQLRQQVAQWLSGPEDTPASLAPLPLTNMRQLREVLYACKYMYQQANRGGAAPASFSGSQALPHTPTYSTHSTATTSYTSPQLGSTSPAAMTSSPSAAATEPRWAGVGEVDAAEQSGGVGVAPEDARPGTGGSLHAQDHPASSSDYNSSLPARGSQDGVGSRSGSSGGASSWQQRGPGSSGGSGNAGSWQQRGPGSSGGSGGNGAGGGSEGSLEAYRSGPGAAKAQLLNENHAKMVAAKKRQKELALTLNATKARIDALRQQQEQLKAARLAAGDEAAQVLSDEELQVLEELTAAKASYREDHGELSAVRSEVEYTAGLVESCKAELMEDFKQWQQQMQGPSGSTPGSSSSSRTVQSPGYQPPGSGGYAAPPSLPTQQPQRTPAYAAAASDDFGTPRRSSRSTTPPLASLLTTLSPADAADPAAQVYYQAAGMLERTANQIKVSTAKQHRGEKGTFTHTGRSEIQRQILRAPGVEN